MDVGEREGKTTSVRPRRSARLKLRKWRALKTRGSNMSEWEGELRGWIEVVMAGNIAYEWDILAVVETTSKGVVLTNVTTKT